MLALNSLLKPPSLLWARRRFLNMTLISTELGAVSQGEGSRQGFLVQLVLDSGYFSRTSSSEWHLHGRSANIPQDPRHFLRSVFLQILGNCQTQLPTGFWVSAHGMIYVDYVCHCVLVKLFTQLHHLSGTSHMPFCLANELICLIAFLKTCSLHVCSWSFYSLMMPLAKKMCFSPQIYWVTECAIWQAM